MGLWRGLQREIGGLRGCILARYNPGALAKRFVFGLTAVNWPWATTKLVEENFENDDLWNGKNSKMEMLWSGFSVTCENYLLWSGNLGLKTV